MRLRTKTLVTVGLTMLGLFTVLFGGAAATLTLRYQELEQEQALRVAARMAGALDAEVRHLSGVAVQTAARDTTYRFMNSRDVSVLPQEYRSNEVPFADFNFAVLLDEQGDPAHAVVVDSDLGTGERASEALVEAVRDARHLRTPGDPHGSVEGLMLLPDGVAIVASHSITSGDAYSRPRGTLVLGRYLNANATDEMSTALGFQVDALAPAGRKADVASGESSSRTLAAPVTWWREVDGTTYAAYTELDDLLGNPAVVLATTFPREARASMQSAIAFAAISLSAVCLAATGIVSWLVDRFVVGRVHNLSAQVRDIEATRDSSKRIVLEGDDEISDLGQSVNSMLDSLEMAERKLVESRDELEVRVQQRTHELSVSDARHRELIERMADAVFSLDLEGRVVLVNRQAELMMGSSRENLIGKDFIHLVSIESVDKIESHLDARSLSGSAWTVEAMLHVEDAAPVPVELRAAPFCGIDGGVEGTQWIARDVTERQRFERQLVHLANHDALTDLANRRAFETALELEIAGVLREDAQGAVIWLDLDDFKDLNDTLGHAAGDEALVTLTGTLRRNVRASNLLARVGGDEFAILMPRADRAEAQAAARRILNAIAGCTCSIQDHAVRFGASLGVVFFPDDGSTVQEVLSNADAAMYRAKEGGRGRIFVRHEAQEPEAIHVSRIKWNERITRALRDEAFAVHAQPVMDLRSGETVRHELLVRMRGDDGELYAPAAFLPAAERLGLINEIDQWMLGQAISILADAESGFDAVDINLSGKVFGEHDMVSAVSQELARLRVDPERLGFEITETAMIADISRASFFVKSLRELGCRVSLDDFGTGFSSFNYLKHLPVSCVKIDGSFVRGLAQSEDDRALIRGIREMCHGLGVEVLAEGVEDEATLEVVGSLGLEYAQGYHIGRPFPVDESRMAER